jgi:hypothetical protein
MSDDEIFLLHALPGGNGDALVVEYGKPGLTHRVLVDGGVAKSALAVGEFLGDDAALELMVVTHIDNDHIAGVLKLFDRDHPPVPEQVWFNGYRHLPETGVEPMGPVEGELLTTLIDGRFNWNGAFDEGPVVVEPTAAPARSLTGGLRLTVLSPGLEQLRVLRQKSTWTEVVREAGTDPNVPPPEPEPLTSGLERMGAPDVAALAAQHTTEDSAPANGSTIALLVEYAKRSCLLAGDAHPSVLIAGIDALVGPEGVLDVDVFKLPHHGSKANVTVELMSRVRAHTYVFSTDGTGRQSHPNDQAVARVIVHGGPSPLLVFNYRSTRNAVWEDPTLKDAHGYRTRYPLEGTAGITVDLMDVPG